VTHRTDSNQASPIELATQDVLTILSASIRQQYTAHQVDRQHGTTEAEFRRILALYFHDKSLADWCHDLGIQDVGDRRDAS
jgi:hypothetical protein